MSYPIEQQMRAEEIERVQKEYQGLYQKLMNSLTEDKMDMIDRLLDLERRLTQMEE
jgi:hypothetical protein